MGVGFMASRIWEFSVFKFWGLGFWIDRALLDSKHSHRQLGACFMFPQGVTRFQET